MARLIETDDTLDTGPSLGEAISIQPIRKPARSRPPGYQLPSHQPPTYQSQRYGEGQRPNLLAMAGSVIAVGSLVAAMLTMNMVSAQKEEKPRLVVYDVLSPPEPPAAPPPPKQEAQPSKKVPASSPVFAPPPLIQVSSAPQQIATTPTPTPPQVSIPGPPSPSPQPAPPVENMGDLSSKMVAATPPRYPQESRRKHEQGIVALLVLLATDGSVADISISRSSGFSRLDQAALSAVRRWRWSPTRRGGAAVMVRGLVEIPFVLRDQ